MGLTRRGRGSSLWLTVSPEPETDFSWFGGTAVTGDRLPAPLSLASPDDNGRGLHMPRRGTAVTVGGGHQAPGSTITGELGHEATEPPAWDPGGRSFGSGCLIIIPQSGSGRRNALSCRKPLAQGQTRVRVFAEALVSCSLTLDFLCCSEGWHLSCLFSFTARQGPPHAAWPRSRCSFMYPHVPHALSNNK